MIIVVFIFSQRVKAAEDISAKSAITIEYLTEKVLYEKNANQVLPMASTTKIMTALTVLKSKIDLGTKFTIPKEATNIEGSSMYLREGEVLTIKQLLYGLMLVSGNDAAMALTLAVSKSQAAFVESMNNIAGELNLSNTYFQNTSGLPDENHYTTAFELARIMAAAMDYEDFREIIKAKSIRVVSENDGYARLLSNHNKLLAQYQDCDGGKTGFTKVAGRCLVSTATRDGVRIITVTLNAPNDWSDHKKMMDLSFGKVKKQVYKDINSLTKQVDIVGGVKGSVAVTNKQQINTLSIDGEVIKPEIKIFMPNVNFAPITTNSSAGNGEVIVGKRVLEGVEMIFTEDVTERKKLTLLERLANNIKRLI